MTNSNSSNRKKRPHYNFQDLLNKAGKTAPNGCIEWQLQLDTSGYGMFWLQGKFHRVHRYVHALMTGGIRADMVVLHSCDNPKCFNPDHLRWGTQLENIADRTAKNRSARIKGEARVNAVLTESQVKLIRQMSADGARVKQIVETIGCSRGAISHVLAGRNWSHVR